MRDELCLKAVLLFEAYASCDFSCSVKEGGILFLEREEVSFHEKDFVV